MNTNLVVEIVGGAPYEYAPLGQHIVQAVGVCGGRPTVKYTRIEMSHLLDRIAQGDSINTINVTDFWQRIPASEKFCLLEFNILNVLTARMTQL